MKGYESSLQVCGTKEDKTDLDAVCTILSSISDGNKLLNSVASKGSTCLLEFDEALDTYGMHETGHHKIRLYPFKKSKKWPDKKMYLKYLASVLGHELTHVLTEDAYIKMIQNAEHLNDVILAQLLSELAARLVGESLASQLIACKMPQTLTSEQKKAYVLDVLHGQPDWTSYYIRKTVKAYDETKRELSPVFQTNQEDSSGERVVIVNMQKGRYPMPEIPRSTQFDSAMDEMLKIIGVDLSAQDVRKIRVPLSGKRKNRLLSKLELKKVWKQIVMRCK